jgi:cap2 methyltransferase
MDRTHVTGACSMKKNARYAPYSYDPSRVAKEHPHCLQAKEHVFASRFIDILPHKHHPRLKYVPENKLEGVSTIHRGQRKLLMSEIGALIRLDPQKQYTVVYAGAAPGIHTPLLSELFPNLTFHLYDPEPFTIKETAKLKLFNDFFTDQTAESYKSNRPENLVFICDIRRTNNEVLVWEDMLAQQKWHNIMQPMMTSLKFRLPWPKNGVVDDSNQVDYLSGDIHLPIWGPRNTTESRLVIEEGRHSGMCTYDCLAYEEEMCYFNRIVRPSVHAWQKSREDGLDGCYDCTAETRLVELYSRVWNHTELSTKRISKELRRGIQAFYS